MLDTKALVEAMAPVIREAIEAARAPLLSRLDAQDREIEALKARTAERGEPGSPGEPGEPGRPGEKGADGVGLAGAVIDRAGALHLTLTNGEVRSLGAIVGRDGVDGQDGKDGERGEAGFSLEDFGVSLKADGRTVELSFSREDLTFVRELALPTMIYRGVYVDGREYEKGDTVTWAGSLWHCNGGEPQGEWTGATTEKPAEGSKAWTLAAKRGRDGKDFAGPIERAARPVRV